MGGFAPRHRRCATPPAQPRRTPGKGRSILVILACQVTALSLWFSATATLPSLALAYELSPFRQSLFTSLVQAGFVAGTLASALLTLPDRADPRRLFMAAALAGALCNGLILAVAPTGTAVLVLRFLTGVALAGVYPVGMKLAASWADRDLGLLVGLLVAALTVGSASPHLFNALGGVDWRVTIAAASAAAALSGLAINLAGIGPRVGRSPPFRPGLVLEAWRNRPLRLANLGYLGHMWELYAMWAWIAVFLKASFAVTMAPDAALSRATLAAFSVIAVGAAGSFAGGVLADRYGRTTVTMAAMATSGAAAIAAGLLFGGPPVLLLAVCVFWGVAVIADSAQFSAAVAELSPPGLVGTMLTLQTAAGFLLTLFTIQLVPVVADAAGWGAAMALLAVGPFLGVLAMARLRASPAARHLAGGRR